MPCTPEMCGRFFDAMDALFIVPRPPGVRGPRPQAFTPQAKTLEPLLRERRNARADGNPNLPPPSTEQGEAARVISEQLVNLFKHHFRLDAHPTKIDVDCAQKCFV